MRRVEEVIDAWFDSGAMPFAQHHYPFENRELIDGRPASPPTSSPRRWTRPAAGSTRCTPSRTLLFDDRSPTRHCIVLGHVNDEQGRKMSKRLGNVVEPMAVIAEIGRRRAALVLLRQQPGAAVALLGPAGARGGAELPAAAVERAVVLHHLRQPRRLAAGQRPEPRVRRAAGARPLDPAPPRPPGRATPPRRSTTTASPTRRGRSRLRRRPHQLVHPPQPRSLLGAGSGGAETAPDADKESAYQALYEVLTTLARLHRAVHALRRRGAPPPPGAQPVDAGAAASVHLEDWPEPAPGRATSRLWSRAWRAVQRIVRLGHAARNTHGLQDPPAARRASPWWPSDRALAGQARPLPRPGARRAERQGGPVGAERRTEYVHHEVRPIFPKTGPRFGKRMPEVKAALDAADGDALARRAGSERRGHDRARRRARRAARPEEVEVRLIEREGMATQGDRELLVALDTALTPELIAEGLAREVVHRIQRARKDARSRLRRSHPRPLRAGAELEQAIDAPPRLDRRRDAGGRARSRRERRAPQVRAGRRRGITRFELAIERV